MDLSTLRILCYQSLLELATEEGINASGKDEIYGCIFGRDSFITILKMLRVHQKQPSSLLLDIARRTLLTHVSLQGKEFRLESGEEVGKFIHEFRREKYDHLLKLEKPWYVYPDGILRNYDSIDATPLALIALYRYVKQTNDQEFLLKVLSSVEAGLNWIISYGDLDKDILIEYELPLIRPFGGLPVQSWTDSHETLMRKDGTMPRYPIAPVEAQGYAWLAMKLWANFYQSHHPSFGKKLEAQAKALKKRFNEVFIFQDGNFQFPAQALDGDKQQIQTITGNQLLLLWAAYFENGKAESILDEQYIPDLVKRSFESDLFETDAGIRTMSSKSPLFNPESDSYHNGSFWPMLNGMIHEGLLNFGFTSYADQLKQASLQPIKYFQTPIELYIKKEPGVYTEFRSKNGQVGCRQQAWSAAALLDCLT